MSTKLPETITIKLPLIYAVALSAFLGWYRLTGKVKSEHLDNDTVNAAIKSTLDQIHKKEF